MQFNAFHKRNILTIRCQSHAAACLWLLSEREQPLTQHVDLTSGMSSGFILIETRQFSFLSKRTLRHAPSENTWCRAHDIHPQPQTGLITPRPAHPPRVSAPPAVTFTKPTAWLTHGGHPVGRLCTFTALQRSFLFPHEWCLETNKLGTFTNTLLIFAVARGAVVTSVKVHQQAWR